MGRQCCRPVVFDAEVSAMTSENQQRLLLLLQLLLTQTDETHYISVADILRFWEAHDIHT
jgi:hypothetical protein